MPFGVVHATRNFVTFPNCNPIEPSFLQFLDVLVLLVVAVLLLLLLLLHVRLHDTDSDGVGRESDVGIVNLLGFSWA